MKTALLFTVLILSSGAASTAQIEDETSSVDPLVHHPQALKGKRLFFEEQERMSSQSVSKGTSKTVPDTGQSYAADKAVKPGVRSGVPAQEIPRKNVPVAVRYDARIESENTLRIIINGMPCDRMDRTMSTRELKGLRVHCSSLRKPSIRLLLLEDGKRIRVMRKSVELGVLALGQEL